jgi:pheromone shutdown protein TraB
MSTFGKEFPSIKRVLIDERNQYMAAIIRELGKTHERIVVVIGDGHVKGIQALIKDNFKDQIEIIRLKEVRNDTWKRINVQTEAGAKSAPHLPPDSAAHISFSFDAE